MERIEWHCEFDSERGVNSYIWILWSVIFIFLSEWIIFILGLGVSLSWLGFIPSNSSLIPSSGIYSIDGQNPISFFVPASGASDALSLYNQVLFKTETLSPGQHKLVVTYQGNSETAPLALDAFIVQNATSLSPSTTSSSIPSSSSSNSASNLGSKKSPRAGLIAGVVVGVVLLVLLLLFFIARRNNRRSQNLKESLETNPEPFTLPRQTYASKVPALQVTPPSPAISGKFTRRRESAYAPGLSRLSPVIGRRIDPTYSGIRNTETIPLPVQPSTSAQRGGDVEFLQHADSGVRMPMPRAQGKNVRVELPPVYTSGWCCFSFY